jgi:hypothetical protein
VKDHFIGVPPNVNPRLGARPIGSNACWRENSYLALKELFSPYQEDKSYFLKPTYFYATICKDSYLQPQSDLWKI